MYAFFKHPKNGDVIETIFTLPYLITYLLMFLNIARAQNPTFSWQTSHEAINMNGFPVTYPVSFCLDLNITYNNPLAGTSLPFPGELIFKNDYKVPECKAGSRTFNPQLNYKPCGNFPTPLPSQIVCDGKFKIDFTLNAYPYNDGSSQTVYPCLVNSFTANGCQIEYMSFADQAKRKEEDTLRTFGIVVGTAASALMLCGLVCCGPKVCAKIKDRRHRADVADEHRKLADNFENEGLSGYGATRV